LGGGFEQGLDGGFGMWRNLVLISHVVERGHGPRPESLGTQDYCTHVPKRGGVLAQAEATANLFTGE